MVEYSVLIKDVYLVDGSGRAPYKSDIGVERGKVTAVGNVKGDAIKEINGRGLTAIPGFIDSHSHGDRSVLWFPECESYVFQGVTTMVTGNCGISPAPINDLIPLPGNEGIEYQMDIEPYKYYPAHNVYPREQVNEVMKEKVGWQIDWYTMGDWFKRIEEKKVSINIAPLVGHGTVRSTVMGDDFKRPSTSDERSEMTSLIRKALDDGCIGLSVGLDYDPDVYADRLELDEHVSILRDYKAIFVPHSRRTGRRRGPTSNRPHYPINGIYEVIDICRTTGVKMNIAHIYVGWRITPQGSEILSEANARATIAVIDNAIVEGLDVSFDVMPFNMVSPYLGASFLCDGFAPWVREKGSREEFAKWLKVPDFRQDIKDVLTSGKWRSWCVPSEDQSWANGCTIFSHIDKNLIGKTLSEIAIVRDTDPWETLCDLLIEDPDSKCGLLRGRTSKEINIDAPHNNVFWDHPAAALGIDTRVWDYEFESTLPTYMLPMIISFSSFPSFIEKYVKRLKHFTIEQAVHKTSTQAAIRFGLKGRGVIREGSYADIVLLDMEKLKVNSTPLNPRQKPSGVEYVLVNGITVAEAGEHRKTYPGEILRRK